MKRLLLAVAVLTGAALAQTTVTGAPSATPVTEWASGGVRTTGSAVVINATRLYSFNVSPLTVTSTKISFQPGTADNTADLYDIGIYSATGTLLCHTGAIAGTTFAPSTSPQTIAFTSTCNLPPARYLLAITGNAATLVLSSGGNAFMAVSNAAPSANNTTAGGVLNNSITPPADNWTNTNGLIQFSLHN